MINEKQEGNQRFYETEVLGLNDEIGMEPLHNLCGIGNTITIVQDSSILT